MSLLINYYSVATIRPNMGRAFGSYQTLMHRDHKVADITLDPNGNIVSIRRIIDRDRMPWGVMTDTDDVLRRLDEWWGYRCIPEKRRHVPHVTDGSNLSTRRALMASSGASNLSDHYWIRPENDDSGWDDVNFYDNDFSEDTGLALLGLMDASDTSRSPDYSTDGVLPKMWRADRTLLKGGTGRCRQQPVNEVIASEIMRRLGIPHVEYSLEHIGDEPYCSCPTLSSDSVELIPARCLAHTIRLRDGRTIYSHFVETCELMNVPDTLEFIDRMIAVDHILGNSDRHYNNFTVMRDPHSLEVLGFAPLFDNGSCLGFESATRDIPPRSVKGRTFKRNLDDQLRLIRDTGCVDLSRLDGIESSVRRILSGSRGRIGDERADAVVSMLRHRIDSLQDHLDEPPGFHDDIRDDIPVR